jgi:hypothetical protein
MKRLALLALTTTATGVAVLLHHHERPAASMPQSTGSATLDPSPRSSELHPSRSRWRSPLSVPSPTHVRRHRHAVAHDWTGVAGCESGGRWHINTGNGYSGGLQFAVATWRAMGGHGWPYLATRAEQQRIAEKLLAVQGVRAWPICGRYLALASR